MVRDQRFEDDLERAKEWLGVRKLSRRELLRFVRGTSGLAAFSAVIAACGGGLSSATTAAASSATRSPAPAASGPVRGGVLTIGYDVEPDTLNPFMTTLLASTESGIWEGLIATDNKMQYQPDLAESIPTVENGGVQTNPQRVTYKLRPNLKWSDGAPLTSADIVFTWQAILAPNFKRGGEDFTGYELIEKIDTPDPLTAIITFKQNYAPYNSMWGALLPKHVLGGKDINTDVAFNRAPVSTGPLRTVKWISGQYDQFERNPYYWMPGKPYLDGMIMKFLPDTNTRINQLRTGEVQYINQVPWDRIDEIAKYPHTTIHTVVANSWEHLDFNMRNPILGQEAVVRQAIAMAIDKQAIVTQLLKGKVPVADNFVSPLSWAYNPNVTKWPYNPEKAKSMLDAAGWKPGSDGVREKNGQRLSFSCTTYSDDVLRVEVQQVIQAECQQIGVQLKIQNFASNVYFAQLNAGKFDIYIHRWIFGADPSYTSLFASDDMPPNGLNDIFWSNAQITSLLHQADQELDQQKRKQLIFQVQDIVAQQLPTIPLFYRINVNATTDKLVGLEMNPTNAGDMWNMADWYLTK